MGGPSTHGQRNKVIIGGWGVGLCLQHYGCRCRQLGCCLLLLTADCCCHSKPTTTLLLLPHACRYGCRRTRPVEKQAPVPATSTGRKRMAAASPATGRLSNWAATAASSSAPTQQSSSGEKGRCMQDPVLVPPHLTHITGPVCCYPSETPSARSSWRRAGATQRRWWWVSCP